jgi:hypothetical protein
MEFITRQFNLVHGKLDAEINLRNQLEVKVAECPAKRDKIMDDKISALTVAKSSKLFEGIFKYKLIRFTVFLLVLLWFSVVSGVSVKELLTKYGF